MRSSTRARSVDEKKLYKNMNQKKKVKVTHI